MNFTLSKYPESFRLHSCTHSHKSVSNFLKSQHQRFAKLFLPSVRLRYTFWAFSMMESRFFRTKIHSSLSILLLMTHILIRLSSTGTMFPNKSTASSFPLGPKIVIVNVLGGLCPFFCLTLLVSELRGMQ